MQTKGIVHLENEVAAALRDGRPVVALESSIIAQGFPRPDNLALAREMTEAVRAGGAVPAVIAVVDGEIRVGADDTLLQRLANEDCAKCGARDLAAVRQAGRLGATTVSATARIAALVGIGVFATGGIGGVHRRNSGAEAPFDVSADLLELTRGKVAVISSGAKAILDLPATLEALETLGVPVLGFGCDWFPAFFCASSGLRVAHRVDDVGAAAVMIHDHWRLGGQGVLLCHPPPESAALPSSDVEDWVSRAVSAAEAAGIAGAAVTPYVLAEIRALSGGRSLAVNRALALANATLGAALAGALAQRKP